MMTLTIFDLPNPRKQLGGVRLIECQKEMNHGEMMRLELLIHITSFQHERFMFYHQLGIFYFSIIQGC